MSDHNSWGKRFASNCYWRIWKNHRNVFCVKKNNSKLCQLPKWQLSKWQLSKWQLSPSGNFPSSNFPSGNFQSVNIQSVNFQSVNFPSGNFLSGNFLSGNFPNGNFPSGNFPNGNFSSDNFPTSVNLAWGGHELWLWARGPSAAARTNLGNCTLRKLPLGKIPYEVAEWGKTLSEIHTLQFECL